MPIRLPDDSHRHCILGRTGSGKTQAAVFHLSHRRFDIMPWIIYNYKRDELIDGIPYAIDIGLDELPTKPGVFISHPLAETDDEAVADHMRAIWDRGNTGVYVDEGLMVHRSNKPFRMLLTQGRSKRIPMMICSQRPAWLDRFVFSESEFFQVFNLQTKKDRAKLMEDIPVDLNQRIPDYHSWYYDVGRDNVQLLKPVPQVDVIYSTFERRLRGQKVAV